MSREPLISIVTPVYNGLPYIKDAIDSVESQSYENREHIVADGNSTDGTVEHLNRRSSVEYVSENDEGLYDALNKTIERANGDFVCWVNADDILAEGALDTMVEMYRANPDADLVVGDSEIFREDGDERVQVRKFEFTDPEAFEQGVIDHTGSAICGCLISTALLDEIGPFDVEFDIAADMEYLCRLAAASLNCAKTDNMVYRYRSHEDSLTFGEGDLGAVSKAASEEVIEFLPDYIDDSEVPEPVREYCRELFRAKNAMLLNHHFTNRDVRKFLDTLDATLHVDRTWPLWAVRTLVAKQLSSLEQLRTTTENV